MSYANRVRVADYSQALPTDNADQPAKPELEAIYARIDNCRSMLRDDADDLTRRLDAVFGPAPSAENVGGARPEASGILGQINDVLDHLEAQVVRFAEQNRRLARLV